MDDKQPEERFIKREAAEMALGRVTTYTFDLGDRAARKAPRAQLTEEERKRLADQIPVITTCVYSPDGRLVSMTLGRGEPGAQ